MKISLNWIKQYVSTDLPVKEIAKRLTMAGLEVEAMHVIGGDWEGIVTGQITAVNRHPNADRLTLLDIELGNRKENVVCGATNVAVGAKIAYAPIGAKLIDPHNNQPTVLKPAKIRGVVSSGMACSEKELGISEQHEGILILPADTSIGIPLTDLLGDVIFTIEVTPNRPDCLSVTGIAREVALLTGSSFKLPEDKYEESGAPIEKQVTVEILDVDLCPRYCASLITGIKIGESPEWLKKSLASYGMRPINNIVDVTNFVMLEYGQPLHSFDYEKIAGKGIIVRRANSGEKLTSLDGIERQLTRDMLVIADKESAVALAGIMGGANSEVTENTTSILLESASFKPSSIRYTGRGLGMPSEACIRFERGISPELTIPALKRATQLIVELGKGQAAKGIIDAYPGKIEKKPIKITTADVKRILGIEFSVKQITDALTAEGCECRTDAHKSEIAVIAPYWRSDFNLQVDVIEEIVRVIGYESIPETLLSQPIPKHHPLPIVGLRSRIRNMMVGYGFQELVTYAYISLDSLSKLSPDSRMPDLIPMRLMNPMSSDYEYMRTSLRPNLLSAVTINKAYTEDGLRLFELGKVYLPKEGNLPDEIDMLCGVICGKRNPGWWQGESDKVDFFDAKGVVESLLTRLNIDAHFEKSSDESLHPGMQACIIAGDKKIGLVGEVHPAVMGHFELNETVYLFELNVPDLLPYIGQRQYQPIPKFPAIVRDMALVLEANVSNQQIMDIFKGFSLITQVMLFDVYVGGQIPAGKKQLAYRLTYQSPTRTFTDEEVNRIQQQVLKKLSSELGASLRG
jgi:phenylalanyl-tRNA synthetase beta chain